MVYSSRIMAIDDLVFGLYHIIDNRLYEQYNLELLNT